MPFYYKRLQPAKDAFLLTRIQSVSEEHPFYGYKTIAIKTSLPNLLYDLYTRQIIGWHVAANHSTELVIEALEMTIGTRAKLPKLFHSDHGSEYISEEFVSKLKEHGITPSNSAKGKPWQNGIAESFYFRFKEELGDTNRFTTFQELFETLCRHFKIYNSKRIHSALKMCPDAFHEKAMRENGDGKNVSEEA